MHISPSRGEEPVPPAEPVLNASFSEGSGLADIKGLRSQHDLEQTITQYGLALSGNLDTILKSRDSAAFEGTIARMRTSAEEFNLLLEHAGKLGVLPGQHKVLSASKRISEVLEFYGEYSAFSGRDVLSLRNEFADCKFELALALPRTKHCGLEELQKSGRPEFSPGKMLEHVHSSLEGLWQQAKEFCRGKYDPQLLETQSPALRRQIGTVKEMLEFAETVEPKLFDQLLKSRMGLEKFEASLVFLESPEISAGDLVAVRAQARRLTRQLAALGADIREAVLRSA